MRPPVRFNQVVALLRNEITSLADEAGHLPTERMLCGITQTSLTTVRKALHRLAEEGLLIRRQGRGTFLKRTVSINGTHAHDQPTRTAKNTIDLLIHHSLGRWPGLGIYSEASLGFCSEGGLHEYAMRLHVVDEKLNSCDRLLGGLNMDNVSGLGLLGIASPEIQRRIQAHGRPIVIMDHWCADGVAADSFGNDSEGDTRDAVRVLLNFGHRRIAFLDRAEAHLNPARQNGYAQAIRDAGLSVDPALIIPSYDHPDFAEKAVAELVKMANRPTAILAFQSQLARYVVNVARKMNIDVPNDLSVVGFGGLQELGMHEGIGLVATDFRELGRLAAKKLVARISGETGQYERTLLPARFYFGHAVTVAPSPNAWQ